MAQQFRFLHPLKFYNHCLSNKIRPDGRDFDQFRPITINLGSISTADGSALCKIGNTTIICGIKAELCTPKAEAPDEGFIVPNLELPPLCSQKFKPGPPSDQAQVYSQLIADVIKNSGCINLKDLCIFPDKLAWCLFVDFICLDFDGAVIDACVLALVGALKSTTLPSIEYDPASNNQQVNLDDRKLLNVHSTPISTTFVVFENKEILSDPTVEEENLCTGILTVVLKGEDLCCVHKPGGSSLTEAEMFDCIEKSKRRAPAIHKLIETAVKTD